MDVFEKSIDNIKKSHESKRNGIIITASGTSIILVILLSQYLFFISHSYNINQQYNFDIYLNGEKADSISSFALPTFFIITAGLTLIIIGIRTIFHSFMNELFSNSNLINNKIHSPIIQLKLKEFFSNNIFWVSAICYFFVTSFLSNTIIFKPFATFTQLYQVPIPSLYIIGCCGLPGYFPVITIYLTDHFGFLLIPINLIFSSLLALLVGVNVSLILYKTQRKFDKKNEFNQTFCEINNKPNSTLISIGAILGLFVECPTCAGSFLIYIFGGNLAAIGITTTFANETQPLFTIASFILLLIPPLLIKFKKI
ncbi:MAG: hypothetical protein ACTHKJ_04305 [Candidatus Nitrosocosmicus sp.]